MENCNVPIHLEDNWRGRRISARQAEGARQPGAYSKCPCCRDDQVPNLNPKRRHSAANLPQKRKRTPVARPSKAPLERPEVPTPQPSTLVADIPRLLNLVPRPQSTAPPADLPGVSNVAPSPQSSTVPLKIHNRSVEYQQIYHKVVDDMLRYKKGRVCPYSLALGRRIKQKLWERLDRPTITTSANEDGLVQVDVSYGVGVYPPVHDIDTLGEPKPPKKRAKK